jgi:PAS domain S-box-containing protein
MSSPEITGMADKPTYEELENKIKALQSDLDRFKQSGEQLAQSESYYRSLLANMHDDILVIDRQYRITDVNKAFLSTSGRKREDVIGRYCYEISHGYSEPCSRYGEVCLLQEVFASGEPATCLHKHVHASGSQVLCDLILSPFKNNNNRVTHVIEVIRDVTNLLDAERKLNENEARFRFLLETMAQGFGIQDENGLLTYVNDMVCKMVGYSKEEIIGRPFTDFIDAANQEIYQQQLIHRKKGASGSYEIELICKNGKKLPVLVSPQPINDIDGSFKGSYAIVTDITSQKRTKETLQKARDQLERRVTSRTEELEIKTKNLEEVNTALKVLLAKRDEDKLELEQKVLVNVKELVLAYLEKLKKSGLDDRQKTYVEIIETNLKDIVSPFLRGLSNKYVNLTPTEIQVANLVKQGRISKEIAELLNLSTRTIEFHRDNIRHKLGIKNKNINLRTHLLSF